MNDGGKRQPPCVMRATLRREFGRLRSSTIPRQLTQLPLAARSPSTRRWARTEISYRGRGRSRSQGRFNFLRISSGKTSDGQSCWGCSRYIRSRARDHCDLVARRIGRSRRLEWPALRQKRPFTQSPISPSDNKRQKATRALHRMAFARLSPGPSRDSVSGRIVCGWRCLSRV